MKSSAPRQERQKNTYTSSRSLKNSNGEMSCQIKLDDFSEGLGTYRELTLASSSTCTTSPKIPKPHIAALSATFFSRWKRRKECDSLWEEIDSHLTDQSPPQHPISPPQNCIVTASYQPQDPGTSWSTSRTFTLTTSWRSMNNTRLPSAWSLNK